MEIRKNTWMGMIRAEQKKKSSKNLISRYKTMNSEGKRAAYDELKSRGLSKDANMLRYGKLRKPTRRNVNPYSSLARGFRFKF
jgi:hypothetical protein